MYTDKILKSHHQIASESLPQITKKPANVTKSAFSRGRSIRSANERFFVSARPVLLNPPSGIGQRGSGGPWRRQEARGGYRRRVADGSLSGRKRRWPGRIMPAVGRARAARAPITLRCAR